MMQTREGIIAGRRLEQRLDNAVLANIRRIAVPSPFQRAMTSSLLMSR